jgi:hypothetical protein
MSLDSVFLTDVKDTTAASTAVDSTSTASGSSELSAAGAYCLALLPEVRYFNCLNLQFCVPIMRQIY